MGNNSGGICFENQQDDSTSVPHKQESPLKINKQNIVQRKEVVEVEEEEEDDPEENLKLQRTITLLKLKANNLLLSNQIADWKLSEKTKELKLLRESLLDVSSEDNSNSNRTEPSPNSVSQTVEEQNKAFVEIIQSPQENNVESNDKLFEADKKPFQGNNVNMKKLGGKPAKPLEAKKIKAAEEATFRSPTPPIADPKDSVSKTPIMTPGGSWVQDDVHTPVVKDVREQLKLWKESPLPDENTAVLKETLAHVDAFSPEHIQLEEMASRETVVDSAALWERPTQAKIKGPPKTLWEQQNSAETNDNIVYKHILRLDSCRGDGRPTSFAGVYEWNPTTQFNDHPTWMRIKNSSSKKTKVYVVYSDNKGRWAVTLAERMTANRNFSVTQPHEGKQPHEMDWGLIENDLWKQTDTTVTALDGLAVSQDSPNHSNQSTPNSTKKKLEEIEEEPSVVEHVAEEEEPGRTEVKAMAALWMAKTKAHHPAKVGVGKLKKTFNPKVAKDVP